MVDDHDKRGMLYDEFYDGVDDVDDFIDVDNGVDVVDDGVDDVDDVDDDDDAVDVVDGVGDVKLPDSISLAVLPSGALISNSGHVS